MTLEELKKALREGEVHFKFKKKDGTIREAFGTLNLGFVPEEHHPIDSSDYVPNHNTTRYFDIDKQAWRSFINENYVDEDATDDTQNVDNEVTNADEYIAPEPTETLADDFIKDIDDIINSITDLNIN